jgi:ATP sulfurylase
MSDKLQGKKILCTVGPASRNERVIQRLEEVGVSLFRINLSHTKLEDVAPIIDQIRSMTRVPICLDTEGAQIRTGVLKNGFIDVNSNAIIRITSTGEIGDESGFSLYPTDILDQLQIGDLISIDFNSVLVQVVEKKKIELLARVLTAGKIGQNKAVSLDREIILPPLTHKDHEALKIGLQKGIRDVALSFANCAADVDLVRGIIGEDATLISKIESIRAIQNLQAIASRSNAVLLDRGDLSREVPIEQIPRAQKEIIRRAKECGAKAYVATNLLESMITSGVPTRAEVNDVFNTLLDGADGLVLAAETAIGAYPVQCGVMVSKLIQQYNEFVDGSKFSVNRLKGQHSLLLVSPHGGSLVDQVSENPDRRDSSAMKRLIVPQTVIMDAEQIALGTFSPLNGFMGQDTLHSVLDTHKLTSGLIWPLPILLQISQDQARNLKKGDDVALILEGSEDAYAILKVDEIYKENLNALARGIFMTDDRNHPGALRLLSGGEYFVAGPVQLLKRLPSPGKYYEITPRQARKIFENNGWSRVVGFQTGNAAHRAHEYLQLKALKDYNCDGVFIHPLVGPQLKGEYSARIILKSYEMTISKYYPKRSSLLAGFQSYPRYAGPREAVFTALCRKNFGCSHFIIDSDHAGVDGFYAPDTYRKLLNQLGDIGIQPVYFETVHYSEALKTYVEDNALNAAGSKTISGTQARTMLQNREIPPDWYMRKDIAELIIQHIEDGSEVFVS